MLCFAYSSSCPQSICSDVDEFAIVICIQDINGLKKICSTIQKHSIAMSIVSVSDIERRDEIWHRVRRDLAAFGVPLEAWPQQPPSCYGGYTVRRRGLPSIQVFLIKQAYWIHRPGADHGEYVMWRGNPAHAWRDAKRICGWPWLTMCLLGVA